MNRFIQTFKKMSWIFQKFLTGFLCFCGVVGGCLTAQTSNIRLSAIATSAQCQADGIISCTLSDTAGEHLEQIKYYYIPLSGQDSIMETSLSEITHVKPGKYKIKVTAVMPTGLPKENAYILVTDSIDEMVVGGTYEVPTCGAFYTIFTFDEPYGIVPSTSCQPTGKVQISIQKGMFPYTVSILKMEDGDTIPYRNTVFDSCMYSGTNKQRYDYRDYYTLDSLEVGKYYIVCHDQCGYYMPGIRISVPKIKPNTQSKYHLIANSSGILKSSNVFKFMELFKDDLIDADSSNDDYYHYFGREQSMYEYRFLNPTICGLTDSTNWLPMPTVTDTSQEAIYYDTIAQIENYGQIWGKNIQLQIRPIPCKDTVLTYTYLIHTPAPLLFFYSMNMDSISKRLPYYDSCGYHSSYSFAKWRLQNFVISNQISSCNNQIFEGLCCNEPEKYSIANQPNPSLYSNTHYYYTFPIHFRLFNLSADTIIEIDTLHQYVQLWQKIYEIDPKLSEDSLLIEISDYFDCPYYSCTTIYDYSPKITEYTSDYHIVKWDAVPLDSGHYCTAEKRMICVFQRYGMDSDESERGFNDSSLFGDTLRLISNPRGNSYNFTVVYCGNKQWQIIEQNLSNTATIRYFLYNDKLSGGKCPGFVYEDFDLPNGLYVWAVYSHCQKKWYTINCNTNFYDVPIITEKPSYKFITQCSKLDIVPTGGQYSSHGEEVNTYFQLCHNDFRYLPESVANRGDTIQVGLPGIYTLSMYTLPRNKSDLLLQNPCLRRDTLINWENENVRFDYISAYVCNSVDSIGFIRAKAKNGKTPYRYTLYDAPDGQGNIIARNQSGIFDNIPIYRNKNMSMEMYDDCGAHFITNFTVNDMEHTRKGWAEDKLNTLALCEGKTCQFYGLSLGKVTYHWTGPNGFYSEIQNPSLFLPRNGAVSGTYYISIEGSGCTTLRDSIVMSVLKAPSVSIFHDTAACPGQEVEITTLTNGKGDINYKMLRKTYLDNDTFCFSARPAGSRDTVKELVRCNQTLYSIIEVNDSQCHYTLPGDSIRIMLLKQANFAEVITRDDSICKGETAILQASSSMSIPSQIQWYQDSLLQYYIRTDSLITIHDVAKFPLPDLQKDTTIFAVSSSTGDCYYRSSGIYDAVRMHTGMKSIHKGENILYCDSGGPDSCYAYNENYQFTFYSEDKLTPLKIQFFYYIGNDSLLQDSTDRLYLFDGDTVSQHPDFTLQGRHQSEPFGTFTTKSGSLTCWFISHHKNSPLRNPRDYAGWRAIISALPKAQPASAFIKPSLKVEIKVTSSSIFDTLRAIAQGGSGDYHYQWQQSLDSLTWIAMEDTIETLLIDKPHVSARYYRVRTIDRQNLICGANSEPFRPELLPVNLRIRYHSLAEAICPGNWKTSITIHNDGNTMANGIQLVQRIQYPDFVHQDTLYFVQLAAHDSTTIMQTFPAKSYDSAYSIFLQAQIADCLQPNEPGSVIFGDWDWQGKPRQQDEDQTVQVVLSLLHDTIFANRYEGNTFSYRDSSTSLLEIGQYTLQWPFENPSGCDSLIIVMLNVSPTPTCPIATDYEGHEYTSVRIGPLCWTQQNLKSRFYSDGRPVPVPMVYYAEMFPDVAKNEEIFGLLYSWQAAMDTAKNTKSSERRQGICPKGWYLPTTKDYERLLHYGLPALRVAKYWINNSGGNNSTGFSALPAGFYDGNIRRFVYILSQTRFWSTSPEPNLNLSYYLPLTYYCNETQIVSDESKNGYSVRCVWHEEEKN